jgi:hypothetical protein
MRRRLEAGRGEGNDAGPIALPPAVIVRGLEDARSVLRAAGARPVLLLSPPEAARLLGPAWWVAMLDAARAEVPGATARGVLDCGDAAGMAQEALAAGADGILFTGPEAQARRLASVAAKAGALLLRAKPATLDMGAYGSARKLPLWLGPRRDTGGAFV